MVKKIFFIFLLFLTTSFLFSLTRYSEKVWYVKPSFKMKFNQNLPFLIFKTPVRCERFVFSEEKRKIFSINDGKINVFSLKFDGIKRISLNEILTPISLRDLNFFIPYKNGIVLGYPERKKKVFPVFFYNLETGKIGTLLKLDKLHFPGIAPIKRAMEVIKKDPSFLDDYFGYVYENSSFSACKVANNKLFMWFRPEYGLHFGGLYIFDLLKKKLYHPLSKFDTLVGVSSNGDFAYTLISDEDATEVKNSIFVNFKNGRKIEVKGARISKGADFSGGFLAYTTGDGFAVIRDVLKNRVVSKFKIKWKDFRIIKITESGFRLFFKVKGNHLYFYDSRDKKIYSLFEENKNFQNISDFYASYDGELILFREGKNLWCGYLTDLTPPIFSVKVKGLIGGRTYKKNVKAVFNVRDRFFISGISEPSISFLGKKYNSRSACTLKLKEGENIFTFSAVDRALNVCRVSKKVIYQKPISVSLKEISSFPERYVGKFLVLEGYAWGWHHAIKGEIGKKIKVLSKLPLAKGNTAKTRNDGTFSDGELTAFLPISPVFPGGKVKIICTIRLMGKNWRIVPLKFMSTKDLTKK